MTPAVPPAYAEGGQGEEVSQVRLLARQSRRVLARGSWLARAGAAAQHRMKARGGLVLLLRHQLAGAIGTVADFASMIGLVELARFAPPGATILSAAVGGVVNFSVSRGWAFRSHHAGSWCAQATRYALASTGGALLNAALLFVCLRAAQTSYAVTRALVAVLVSLAYTYPVHTLFVFRVQPRALS